MKFDLHLNRNELLGFLEVIVEHFRENTGNKWDDDIGWELAYKQIRALIIEYKCEK